MGMVRGRGSVDRMASAMLSEDVGVRARGDCVECGKPFVKHRGVQTHVYKRSDGFQAAAEVPTRWNGTAWAEGTRHGVGRLSPKTPLSRAGTPLKHRPWHWWCFWRGPCRCWECNRKPDYEHIKAMEIECGIRGEDGQLVWQYRIGDQDEEGRTVVAVIDGGQPVWDRAARPRPPARDLGERSWV